MTPRNLAPAVTVRRAESAYLGITGLDAAAQVPGPQQPVVAAASGFVSFVNSITGNSHRFAGTTYEGAEQARADAGALGAAAGSVQAARFLLSQQKTDTSNYAKSATAAAIQQATAANPAVMAQARATPLTDADKDQADGSGVLGILWQLQIPFSDPYAGYSTNNGAPGSTTATQLAAKLRQLPPLAAGALPGVSAIQSLPAAPVTVAPAQPILNTAGLTQPLNTLQQLAAKVASGALSVSQLANLSGADLALIQQQVQAIKQGNVPPGGLSVFVANNKPLVYGGGAVIGVYVLHKAGIL